MGYNAYGIIQLSYFSFKMCYVIICVNVQFLGNYSLFSFDTGKVCWCLCCNWTLVVNLSMGNEKIFQKIPSIVMVRTDTAITQNSQLL